MSQCAPNLQGFVCHQCKPGSFRLLPSRGKCQTCFLQDETGLVLGKILSLTILLFLLFAFVPLLRRIGTAIPSLYSIIPFLQIFALMKAQLGFSWPDISEVLSLPASVFAINLNLSFYECFDIIHNSETKWALLVSVPWCLAAMKLVSWGIGIALLRAGGKFRRWSWINESNQISIRHEYVADSIYAFVSTMIPCAGMRGL